MLNRELDVAFAEMDALARALLGGRRAGWRSDASDFSEVDDAFVWKAHLPGLGQEDVELRLEDGVLQVEASRSVVAPAEGLQAVHRERQAYRLHRRWRLPDHVDPEGIEARLTDGVLTVRLPKRAEALPRRIPVQG